jgi:hypothetical protein
MKWEVQISGDVHDLGELAKSLTNDNLRIIERDGQFFLETIRFSELTTSEEVTAATSDLLPMLTGASRLSLGGRTPIQIANIAKVREDGSRSLFVKVQEEIHVRHTVSLGITKSDGSIEVVNPADKVPDWINAASKCPNVAKALRLLGTHEHDWVSLYRLYEVIEADVGGIKKITSEGWATTKAISRFKHTANSPGAIGDSARHGKESRDPPLKSMDLGEAVALVKVILHNWLRSKMNN